MITNFTEANQYAIDTDKTDISPESVLSIARFSIISHRPAIGIILDKNLPARIRRLEVVKTESTIQPNPIDKEYKTRNTKYFYE